MRADFDGRRDRISLLTDFEDCQDAYDWTLETHGIWLHFSATRDSSKRDKTYSATFLPGVATDAGWDKQDTLEHAIKKSGYSYARFECKARKLMVEQRQDRRRVNPIPQGAAVSELKGVCLRS
jgi:AMMECR1 domain-containing protein